MNGVEHNTLKALTKVNFTEPKEFGQGFEDKQDLERKERIESVFQMEPTHTIKKS